MKKIFYLVALFAAVLLTACDGSSVQTPEGDKTKLWPAGKKDSQLMGFINKSGEFEIPAKYDNAVGFSCGWAFVIEDGEYMFIDKNAKNKHSVDKEELVADQVYFMYNHLRFNDGDYYGMWDNDFATVIPADYKYLGEPSADKLVGFKEELGDDEGFGYLDMKGNVAIEPQWYHGAAFVDGMAAVWTVKGSGLDVTYKYGIINKKGEYIVEPQKNYIYSMGESRLAMGKTNGKYVLCDKNLEELSSSYDDLYPFSCGMAQVYKNEKGHGFIDKNGQEIVSCKYLHANNYLEDMVFVLKDNDSKWEVLDKNGNSILKLKEGEYPLDEGFHNGLACVYSYDDDAKANSYRYINKNGETIYKWTPGDEDEEEDDAPFNRESLRRMSIMQSEVGALFLNYEEAKQRMK